MKAKILSYSRSQGVFAGLELKGSTLRQDKDCPREKPEGRLIVRRAVQCGSKTESVRESVGPAPQGVSGELVLPSSTVASPAVTHVRGIV
jgi:Las17-binding protein actin regulator